MRRRCAVVTSRGPCRFTPLVGSDWCFNHAPHLGVERAQARRLGGQRRKRASHDGIPISLSLRTVDDVIQLLERAARDAVALDLSPERCRVLIAAAGQSLKAIEVGAIEERLAALELAAGVHRKGVA